MEEITALAKRRGFIFPSSEIYGGIGGLYDYGPLGAVLKRNVRDAWWRENVLRRDDVVAYESSILMHPLVWKASGHVDVFTDKLVDCRHCKHRFRADHLASLEKCPNCGMSGTLTEPRDFNLMLRTSIGPMEDTASQAYLRPETAQGIFVNFKNIYQTARRRPPFGIAQIGKSFRNEITPGNFTYRMREFDQMELEYFVPHDGTDMDAIARGSRRARRGTRYGIKAEKLRFYELTPDERPHYAKACTDVEYEFPWGWGELESIAHRGTYDLDAHMKLSGKDLSYFDEATKTKYVPILIESSAGLTARRWSCSSTRSNGRRRSMRTARRSSASSSVPPARSRRSASPSSRSRATNPNSSSARARIERHLRERYRTQYDEGNIGQLYRRQDEIGTPYCVTVDYDTLEDGTVTVRERDSMRQERIAAAALDEYFASACDAPPAVPTSG